MIDTRLKTLKFSLIGFAVFLGMFMVTEHATKITGGYWSAFAINSAIIFAYFWFIHPRLRLYRGYEYSALMVGFLGGMMAIITFCMALVEVHIF